MNPFGTRIDPGLSRLERASVISLRASFTLGKANCLPVGNAGNITAYWKGYREYAEAGLSDTLPRMMGWQAAGAAPGRLTG